ncbi:hypothetical protein ACO0K8_09085 [Undibacterium sp. Ren11W]
MAAPHANVQSQNSRVMVKSSNLGKPALTHKPVVVKLAGIVKKAAANEDSDRF